MNLKVRVPTVMQPTAANFAIVDWSQNEVVLNLCFAEGAQDAPNATLVHRVVMHPANFARLLATGQEVMDLYHMKHGEP